MDRKELLLYTLQNQYLLEKTERLAVLSDLCGLQAQFANNPKYALRIRARDFRESTWGEGLVKIWSHRNTMHAVRADEIGLYLSAKGAERGWTESWWGIPAAIKPYWSAFLREKIAAGIDGREALKDECRRAGMEQELVERVFHGWGGLIKEMCDRGLIACHIGTEKRFLLPKEPVWMERDAARLLLLERYFRHFGPATPADCAAFTGYRISEVHALLKLDKLPLNRLLCNGVEYLYAGELSASHPLPACIYLSGFDQLIMGYRDRSRFLDDADRQKVVNQAGIVFPTILWKGRLRARWKKEPGKLLITPFRPLSPTARDAIAAKGRRLFAGESIDVSFQESLSS